MRNFHVPGVFKLLYNTIGVLLALSLACELVYVSPTQKACDVLTKRVPTTIHSGDSVLRISIDSGDLDRTNLACSYQEVAPLLGVD